MFTYLKNKTIYRNKYKYHKDAVVIACFYNPQMSTARVNNAYKFYSSIQHLNHRIIECSIKNSPFYLPNNEFITRIYSDTLLWHKETLLNKIINDLPKQFKYVFWVDMDVIFENDNWLVEGVKQLQDNNIIQPFSYCFHLNKGETYPKTTYMNYLATLSQPNVLYNKCWRSFCSNYKIGYTKSTDYNKHGHVGFAWGARRELLNSVQLYERALVGGADHIIAHAAAGEINHECITKSFNEDLQAVNEWSKKFDYFCKRKIGYVQGNLFHLWHGDIEKRDYFNRVKKFTPLSKTIVQKDNNGLYHSDDSYIAGFMTDYFQKREESETFIPGGGLFGGGGASSSWDEATPNEGNINGITKITPFS
jgi:hypothetical protein